MTITRPLALPLAATLLITTNLACDSPGHDASSSPTGAAPKVSVSDRPTDNSACLACHETFADEGISVKHAGEKIFCADCHGTSIAHMQDESGMTEPDVLFGRKEIDPFCSECHSHHHDEKEVAAFIAEWDGKRRPNGRFITAQSVCTDCHGTHAMPQPDRDAGAEAPAWIPLFNGKDLTGWEEIGKAKWVVEDGKLIGTQGEDFGPGDLLTAEEFDNFALTVTYRTEWPCNSGVWFRYQSEKVTYQADILEYANPEAYSGTLYCPGKMFLAINADKALVNRDGWNTLNIRCEGDRSQIWLNGQQVADVRDDTTDHGKIGFQIHPGDQFGPMKLVVREIRLQKLP